MHTMYLMPTSKCLIFTNIINLLTFSILFKNTVKSWKLLQILAFESNNSLTLIEQNRINNPGKTAASHVINVRLTGLKTSRRRHRFKRLLELPSWITFCLSDSGTKTPVC